jgi:hypothetical protein
MSGVFKAIGKVFKKVAKVVKKVLPYALVIGAIVLTGGAAIGALPAVGSIIGGLGLSAGVTTALTSAVTMAGWGGLAGLVTGGPKGMLKGGLMGAIGGGILGVAGPALGSLGGATSALQGGAGALPFDALSAGTAGANVAGASATAGGGGIVSGLLGSGGSGGGSFLNNGILGNILSGVGSGQQAAADYKAQKKLMEAKAHVYDENYDLSGSPLTSGLLSPYTLGYKDLQAPELDAYSSPTAWVYDPTQGKVVRRQSAPGG